MKLFSSLCLGVMFGYLMNRSEVHLSLIIRDQMLFRRLTMMKMFLAAVGTSMLSVTIISFFNRSLYDRVFQNFVQRNNRINGEKQRFLPSTTEDSILFSCAIVSRRLSDWHWNDLVGNMSRNSLCSTVSLIFSTINDLRSFSSSGSGLFSSLFTCLGAFAGVLFYYKFVDPSLSRVELDKSSVVLQTVSSRFGWNRLSVHLILSLVFISLSFLLEVLIPFRGDLRDFDARLIASSWSPFWSGVGVGSLQLFFMLLFERSLGVSTGFSVLLGQFTRWKFFSTTFPSSLQSFRDGLNNYLTLLFTIGVIGGSFLSTSLSVGYPLQQYYGSNKSTSFIGGFLLLLGARCAGGCTSGQGISGLSHLLIGSILATAAMFAGGILTAFLYVFTTADWTFSQI